MTDEIAKLKPTETVISHYSKPTDNTTDSSQLPPAY